MVDRVDDSLRTDRLAAKEPAVEASDGVLSTFHSVKFDINVSVGVRVNSEMDNVAIFILTFATYVVFEFFDPGFANFPENH